MIASFENLTLAEITMQKLEMIEEVNKVYNDTSLQKFFDAFLNNFTLIEWLRTVTKGMFFIYSWHNVCGCYISSMYI